MNGNGFVKWLLGIMATLVVVGIVGGVGLKSRVDVLAAEAKAHEEKPVHDKGGQVIQELKDQAIRQEATNATVKQNQATLVKISDDLQELKLLIRNKQGER